MTVAELIEQLSEYDGECEVRIASQPQWPFENEIDEVIGDDGSNCAEDDEPQAAAEDQPMVVYIGEGRQIGYLPGSATQALGWNRR